MLPDRQPRALLVDLNNFAAYPTLAIGYLVAALRATDIEVEVLSPLHHGVSPVIREPTETRRTHIQRRVYHCSHPIAGRAHDLLRAGWVAYNQRPERRVLDQVGMALRNGRVDVLLLSAYLDHYPSVKALAALASERSIPVVLGGPMFSIPEVTREWLDIPGLTAVVGGEADTTISAIVRAVVDRQDLVQYPGVFLPDGRKSGPAPPLQDLRALPLPDLRDFPWDKYPRRIIPVMTGRGCGWGRCLFCSDVITSNGRGFRSRPVDAVLEEMVQQSERHASRDFVFLDIKLNSDLRLWRALADHIPQRLPGARWMGTVHVQARGDNGLTREDLQRAAEAGMQRISFGLETGSQEVNNKMAKGTSVQRTAVFLRDAHRAGLSVRTTMMLGYPGELTADLRKTIGFLRTHEDHLDRIAIGRFKALPGTRFHERYTRQPDDYSQLTGMEWNLRAARARYFNRDASNRHYRRAKSELLGIVHRANRQPLRGGADVFNGVM